MKNRIKGSSSILVLGVLFLNLACTKDFDYEDTVTVGTKVIDASTLKYTGKYNNPCYDVIRNTFVSDDGTPIAENVINNGSNLNRTSTVQGVLAGFGYNPYNNMLLERPFKAPELTTNGSASSVTFSSIQNSSEKLNAINVAGSISLSGNYRKAGVRANFSGSYEQNINRVVKGNANSFFMTGSINVGTGGYVVSNSYLNLTDAAKTYAQNPVNGYSFNDLYGPYFISKEVTGGSLTVILEIAYTDTNMSYAQKQAFQASAGVRFFGAAASADASATITQESTTAAANATVKFSAFSNCPFVLPSGILNSTFNPNKFLSLQESFTTSIVNDPIKHVISQEYSLYNPAIFPVGAVRDKAIEFQKSLSIQYNNSAALAEYLFNLNSVTESNSSIDTQYLISEKSATTLTLDNSNAKLYDTSINALTSKQLVLQNLINALPYIRTFYWLTGLGGAANATFISADLYWYWNNNGSIFKAYDTSIYNNTTIDFSNLNLIGLWEWNNSNYMGYNRFYGIGSPNPQYNPGNIGGSTGYINPSLKCCFSNAASLPMSSKLYRTFSAGAHRYSRENTSGAIFVCDVIAP